MLKIIGISYVLCAIAFAVYSTINQSQPALFFIDLTAVYGKFSATLVMLITALCLIAPMVIILFLIGKFQKNKNFLPDLNGKTGIVVHRKKALYNAIYTTTILIDGQKKSAVSNGKSTFIELPYGRYNLQVGTKKTQGIEVILAKSGIINVEMNYVDEGLKAKLVLTILS